ncbi:hypothetical protein [Lactobacillus delbrueckii]|uniref:hypothetical protein n=1 Tax=Lactobacillus delbrueckii TaxID=1584 RepID=UPI002169647B|nr:hypothetical protein [Lactobacillus delbrueckii]
MFSTLPLIPGYTNFSSFYAHFRKLSGMPPAKYRQLFAQNISRAVMDTPIGPLRILASQDAILCVEPANYLEKRLDKLQSKSRLTGLSQMTRQVTWLRPA